MHTYTFCPKCATPLQEAIIENRDRQQCPACSWIHYRNPLPVTIAYARNQDDELLVIRRAHPPAENEWALPGGFLEIGETPEEGCLRELREETSLEGRVDGLIGAYHRENEMYGSLLVIAYKITVHKPEIHINHEVHEAGFYRPNALPDIRIPLHNQIISDAEALVSPGSLR